MANILDTHTYKSIKFSNKNIIGVVEKKKSLILIGT